MRRIAVLFAVAAGLSTALMLYRDNLPAVDYENARAALAVIPGVGGWAAPGRHLNLADPVGERVIPMQMMKDTKDLPAEQSRDYSLVFD